MIGNQLPDRFNFGATDIAPAITKLRLHDRQHRRSILERKHIVESFCGQVARVVQRLSAATVTDGNSLSEKYDKRPNTQQNQQWPQPTQRTLEFKSPTKTSDQLGASQAVAEACTPQPNDQEND
jgi:nucleotidyltransferase/DNA polymerase involved in DNA repair